MQIRLQTFLRDHKIASRRGAEELIRAGVVTVNGQCVTEMGSKVDPALDQVAVRGQAVTDNAEQPVYLAFHKPRGVISSRSGGPNNKVTVFDYLPQNQGLFLVGRLDLDSEGLMLVTSDGLWANRLMHPKYDHEKEYVVTTKQPISDQALDTLRKGVIIPVDGVPYQTRPAQLERLDERKFKLVLTEGKKRQIRLMCEAVNTPVLFLKRIRIAKIKLGTLQKGEYRVLTPKEIASIPSELPQ